PPPRRGRARPARTPESMAARVSLPGRVYSRRLLGSALAAAHQSEGGQAMPTPFKGTINLDVRDSTPDWEAVLADRAPEGARNVRVVLYDARGCAAWSPYGGRIEMPTLDRLAAKGLTFSQWHTTALCSPTRSTFLTGRNHHLNGFAQIAEGAQGFPGYSTH